MIHAYTSVFESYKIDAKCVKISIQEDQPDQ